MNGHFRNFSNAYQTPIIETNEEIPTDEMSEDEESTSKPLSSLGKDLIC